MSESLKPLILHNHPGPNPWKVALILEYLSIPWTSVLRTTEDMQDAAYLKLCPAAISPVLEDPNTHIILWESNPCIDYLLEVYDKGHTISFAGLADRMHMAQWMSYQTTSQGPPIQALRALTVVAPSAEGRSFYTAKTLRMLQTMEVVLGEQEWLVGRKCSAADLGFILFHTIMHLWLCAAMPDLEAEYPAYNAWMTRMLEMPIVKQLMAQRAEAIRPK